MKKLFLMVAMFCLLGLPVFADEALPKPVPTTKKVTPKSINSNLGIRLDRNAKEAKLIIPKSQLKQLKAELDRMDGDPAEASADAGNHRSTIIGGIFLSLGFIFGGVWFFRSSAADHGKSKVIVGLLVVILTTATGTILLANAGPPLEARSITSKLFSPVVRSYGYSYGAIKIEISETARTVELVVPDVPEAKTPKEEE
jgi:hypothetical protein